MDVNGARKAGSQRIDPARALGLREGDAHVIRNACGRASEDAIGWLVISYKLLGTVFARGRLHRLA